MITSLMVDRLRKLGVYIQSGGLRFNSVAFGLHGLPLVVIYENSEEPTNEELRQLHELVLDCCEIQFGQRTSRREEFRATGASTITVQKLSDDSWQYRNLTWTVGPPWQPYEAGVTLEELRRRIHPYLSAPFG